MGTPNIATATIMPRLRGLRATFHFLYTVGSTKESAAKKEIGEGRLNDQRPGILHKTKSLYTLLMPTLISPRRFLFVVTMFVMALPTCLLHAQEHPDFTGKWLFNADLSDNTDKKVEAALKAAGEKINRKLFDRRQDRYRGGPAEQELYDRISYDRELTISLDGEEYIFTYADNFIRPVYTDNRSRSVSLAGLDEVEDFSFAHWEGEKLMVEARPRDGGFADETYSLINNGARLQMEFHIQPKGFLVPIELKRIFDRQPAP